MAGAMDSGIHQLHKNTYPPADSDDDDSFVVLDSIGPNSCVQVNVEPLSIDVVQKTLDAISETLLKSSQSMPSNPDSMKKSGRPSCGTSYVSITGEEIQKNVDNLIAENVKLKDALTQNNLTMRAQVEKIMKWQEEVQHVQESHKKKFAEMKTTIQELKSENEKLKEFQNKCADTKMESVNVKKDNYLQFELEAAQKKIKEMEKALDMIITEKQNLNAEMNSYKVEISNYREEIQRLQTENMNSQNSLWVVMEKELVEEKNTLLAKYNELKSEINKIREERDNLSKLNEMMTEKEKLWTKKEAELIKAQEMQIADNVKLRESYCLAKNSEAKLIEAIQLYKQQLQESEKNVAELTDSFNAETKNNIDQIKSLEAKLNDASLKDELVAMNVQLDVYKRDFETERTIKNDIMLEKNRMADELQSLQRRNEQLMEEIDQLRSGFVPLPAPEQTAEQTTSANRSSPPSTDRYTCPICIRKFRSLLLLEDHIEYCFPQE